MDTDNFVANDIKRPRKRSKVADPENWAKNVRKTLRNSGKAYVDVTGKVRHARSVKPKDCTTCRKQCNEKFSEATRQKIHKSYWGLGDLEKQWVYISSLVESAPVKHRTTKKTEESRRSVSRKYFLRMGKLRAPVCKGFFLATLDISEQVVAYIVNKRDEETFFPPPDNRGKAQRDRSKAEEARECIREHIRSVLLKRKIKGEEVHYMPEGYNAKRLYEMYVEQCSWKGVETEKMWLYRKVLAEFEVQCLHKSTEGSETTICNSVAPPPEGESTFFFIEN